MDYNNNKSINFLENIIEPSLNNQQFINDISSFIVIDTSNHKIGINILNPQYQIDVCNGVTKTSNLLCNDICVNYIYNITDLKISNDTIKFFDNTTCKIYIDTIDVSFFITRNNDLEIINLDLDHFNITVGNKDSITDEDKNLYIRTKSNTRNYSIQIYLDNSINTSLPIHNSKTDETSIIYPTTYSSADINHNHSYGKFKYKSIKGLIIQNKTINAPYVLNMTEQAYIPFLDELINVSFGYSYVENIIDFNNLFNSFPYSLSTAPKKNEFGGLIAKLNYDNFVDGSNTASFIYYDNNNYWTTLGDNLNLYDGSLSCGSIDISFNNNFITIDSSNIKNNDQLNIISDTLKIESSNCNINIYNNLNIDASNVLIDSSNITLSGEINIKGETLINNISFIEDKINSKDQINSNNLEILANEIANIICKKLNITSEITTISGNTTIDGSLNIKENGIINRYAHVPIGTIVMWNQIYIPNGWALCDGENGRPDLRDKFVKGANRSLNNLGASSENVETIKLTMDYFPDHSHNITYNINYANDSHYHNFSISISNDNTNHYHDLSDVSLEIWNDGSHDHGITIVNNLQTIHNDHKHTISNYHTHDISEVDHNHEHFISHNGKVNHTHQINMKMLMDISSEFNDLPENETSKLVNRSEVYEIDNSTNKILQRKFVKTTNNGASNYYQTINTQTVTDANALNFKNYSKFVSNVNNFHDTKIDINLNAPNNDISTQHVNSFIRSNAGHNKTGNIVYTNYKKLLDTNYDNSISQAEIASSKIGSINENNIFNINNYETTIGTDHNLNVLTFESIFTVIRNDISINDLYVNNWKSLQFPFDKFDSDFIMINPNNQTGLSGSYDTTIYDQIARSNEITIKYNIGNSNPNEQLYSTIMLNWNKGNNYEEFDTYFNIVSYGGFNSDNCRQPLVSLKYNNNKTDISFVCVENNLTISNFTNTFNGVDGYYLEIKNKTNKKFYPNLGKIEYSNSGSITSYIKIKLNNLDTYWLLIEKIEGYYVDSESDKSCKLKISDYYLDELSWNDLSASIATIESVNLMNEENDNDFYFMQEYNGEPITKTNFYKLLEPISINAYNVTDYYKKINDNIMHSTNILIENISKANEMGYTFNNIIKLFPNLYKNTIDWIINKDPKAYPENDIWFNTSTILNTQNVPSHPNSQYNVQNFCYNEFDLGDQVYYKNFFMDICIYYFSTANNINIGTTLDGNRWAEMTNNNYPQTTNWVSYINYHFINKYVFSGDNSGASIDQNRKTIEYMRNTAPSIYEFLILKWMQYFAELKQKDDADINLIDASINSGYSNTNVDVINSPNAVTDICNNSIEYYLHSYIDDSVPDLSGSGNWSIKFRPFEHTLRMHDYLWNYPVADDKQQDNILLNADSYSDETIESLYPGYTRYKESNYLVGSNMGNKYIGGYFVKREQVSISSESFYYYYDLSFLRSYTGNVSQDYYDDNNAALSFYVNMSTSQIMFTKPVTITDLVDNTDSANTMKNYITSRADNYPYDYLQKLYAEILYDSYKKFKNVRVGEIKTYLNTSYLNIIDGYSNEFSHNSNQNPIKYIEPELPTINGDGKYFNLCENLDLSSNIIYIEVSNNITTNPETNERQRFNSIAEYILPKCKLLLYDDSNNDYSELVDIIKVADREYTTKDFLEPNAVLDQNIYNLGRQFRPEYTDASLSHSESILNGVNSYNRNLYKLSFYISRTDNKKYFDKTLTSIKIYNTYKLSPINNIKVTNTNDTILNQEELKDKQERSYIIVSDLSGGYYYNYNINGYNEIVHHFNIEIFKNDRNWDYYNNEPKNIKIVDRKLDPNNIYYLKRTYADSSFIPYNYTPEDLNKSNSGIEYMKIIDFSNIDDHIFKFTVLRNMNMYYKDTKYFKYGEYNDSYNKTNLQQTLTEYDRNRFFYNNIKNTGPLSGNIRNSSWPDKKTKEYNSIPIYNELNMEVYFAFSNTGLYDIHTTQGNSDPHPVFGNVTYNDGSSFPDYSSNFFDTVFTNIYYNNYYKPYPVTFSNYTDVYKQSVINMSLNFFNNIMYTTQVELKMDEYVHGLNGTYYQNRRDYFTDMQSFCDYLNNNIIKDQVNWEYEDSCKLFLNKDDDTNNAAIKNYALKWINWCKQKLQDADTSNNIEFRYEYAQGERYYWLLRKFIKIRYRNAWDNGNMYASVFNIEKVGDSSMCKTVFNRDEDFYNKYTYTTDKFGKTTFDEPNNANPWYDYLVGNTVNTTEKQIDIVEWIRQFVFNNDSIIGPFTYAISRDNLTMKDNDSYKDLYNKMTTDPPTVWVLPEFDNTQTVIHYDTFICNENRWEIVNYILMVMLFADERRPNTTITDVSSYNYITKDTSLNSMDPEAAITKPKLFLTLSLLSNMIDELSTHKKFLYRKVIDSNETRLSVSDKLELLVPIENEYDYNTLHNHGGYTNVTELKTNNVENNHSHSLSSTMLDNMKINNTNDISHTHNLGNTDYNNSNSTTHRHVITKDWITDNSNLQKYISFDTNGNPNNDQHHTHNLSIENIRNTYNYNIINKSNDISINIHPSHYTLIYIMKE